MTVTDPAPETLELLDEAASLLDSVGADRPIVPAEVALKCLHAAELLERAGGRASRVALVDGDAGATIRAAMTALSQLDPATFGAEPVLGAARTARRALRLLGA